MIVSYEEAAAFIARQANPDLAANPAFRIEVDAANTFVAEYCRRPFARAAFIEVLAGTGENHIFVSEDIESITEVRIDPWEGLFGLDTVQTDLTRFAFLKNRLTWLDGRFGRNAAEVKITYMGGYYPFSDADPLHATRRMPATLFRATCQIVAINWKAQPGEERMLAESIGAGSYSYSRGVGRQLAYASEIMDVLDEFTRWA